MLSAYDQRLREAAIDWVAARLAADAFISYEEAAAFEFEGTRIALIDRQRGIRKPKVLQAALAIRTTFTPPGRERPYDDNIGPDGLWRYKYRGENRRHPENIALRIAMETRVPLIWFMGVAKGVFTAIAPVWLVNEEERQHQFVVALDETQRWTDPSTLDEDHRAYVERLTRLRLHQPVFRARVLHAYDRQCAMCRLRLPDLLDAAHIVPDHELAGTPVVPNGLALCKIHHAAFDRHILGVRPDCVIEVRQDILDAVDGPMLRHGLQELSRQPLVIPAARNARPDPDRLEARYELFRRA